jgi:hypothetical protein
MMTSSIRVRSQSHFSKVQTPRTGIASDMEIRRDLSSIHTFVIGGLSKPRLETKDIDTSAVLLRNWFDIQISR